MEKWPLFIAIIVIIVLAIFALSAPKQNTSAKDFCNTDSDCVPASCCHSNSTVNKAFAPDCGKVFCTEECRTGTLDCGFGTIKCVNSKCTVLLRELK